MLVKKITNIILKVWESKILNTKIVFEIHESIGYFNMDKLSFAMENLYVFFQN